MNIPMNVKLANIWIESAQAQSVVGVGGVPELFRLARREKSRAWTG